MQKETISFGDHIVKAIEFIYVPSTTVRQSATDFFETRTTAMQTEFNSCLFRYRKMLMVIQWWWRDRNKDYMSNNKNVIQKRYLRALLLNVSKNLDTGKWIKKYI